METPALEAEHDHEPGHAGVPDGGSTQRDPPSRIGGGNDELLLVREGSDVMLLVRVARRDQAALAELYRRHGGSVLALAQRVLVDRNLAEEIVQEVFLRVWREPERFDPARGSLRAFLLTQAHGRAVDLVRSESSRRIREARDAASQVDLTTPHEEHMVDPQVAPLVQKAMAELRQSERAAIELAYFGGCSYREVALRLDSPEGTVKSRIRSGLGKLRTNLVAAGVDPY